MKVTGTPTRRGLYKASFSSDGYDRTGEENWFNSKSAGYFGGLVEFIDYINEVEFLHGRM